jgi:hypothetical protein
MAQLEGPLTIPRLSHHREGGIIGEGVRQAPTDRRRVFDDEDTER